MVRAAAIVIGGGPAGSTASIRLARAGLNPLLFERCREPRDVVCGGFVSADAVDLLSQIGVSIRSLGARPITQLRVIAGGRRVETALPFVAFGLSRRVLDSHLLQAAARAGASIERGISIRQLDPATLRVDLSDGSAVSADAIFLATGKHDLRGLSRKPKETGDRSYVGFRTVLSKSPDLSRILKDTIELHLFESGYAGLLLQEDGTANFCLSVSKGRLKEASGHPDLLVAGLEAQAPLLADRLGAAASNAPWSSIARVPYGWRAADSFPGIFRLGDQAAVIPSLVGDGIAIALASAGLASDALIRSGPGAAAEYQRLFSRRASRPLTIASIIRRIAETQRFAQPLLSMLGFQPRALSVAASMTRIC